MIDPNAPEFASAAAFAVFLQDDERLTYTLEELTALNARTHLPQHELRHALEAEGLTLAERHAAPRVRGFTTSNHDRWYGPGSDQTHGGGGF